LRPGAGADFPAFLDLVMHQDYPDYRMVLVTQSADDRRSRGSQLLAMAPDQQVWKSSRAPGEEVREVEFIVAGLSENEGRRFTTNGRLEPYTAG